MTAGADSSCCNPPSSHTHKQLPGEDQDTIAARKSQHAWGAWINGDAPPPASAAAAAAAGSGGEDAEEAGSGASEQTGRRGGGAEEVEEGQEVAGAAAAAGGGRKGGRGKKAAQRDQVGTRVVAGAACAVVATAR